ncbi:ribosomal protein L7Ae/L30e/S12e/Gadd45 [Tanacetum coccineum]
MVDGITGDPQHTLETTEEWDGDMLIDPEKIILAGEHVVVHGSAAVATAIAVYTSSRFDYTRLLRWEELIRENVFGLGGHQDHLPASLVHMLYCIVAEEQYNLAYFFVKRIECARATSTANLPYGMFLTRLYPHVMEHYPHLDNGIYNVVDRVMRDDDGDDGASRASTPSPTTYLNSLSPLNYEKYNIPTSSQQDDDLLFERQTALLNQTQKMHKELRGGFKSFREALEGVFCKKKK